MLIDSNITQTLFRSIKRLKLTKKTQLIGTILGGILFFHSPIIQANKEFALEKIGCPTMPSKDITISEETVTLQKNNKTWTIARDGTMSLNGQFVKLSSAQQAKAEEFQSTIRKELPVLHTDASMLIETNLTKLDGILAELLGSNSQLRSKLAELKPIAMNEFNQIFISTNAQLTLSASNLANINQRVDALKNTHGQSVLQVALSEIAMQKLLGPKDQNINLSDLRTRLQTTFKPEDQKARKLLSTACNSFANWQTLESGFISE